MTGKLVEVPWGDGSMRLLAASTPIEMPSGDIVYAVEGGWRHRATDRVHTWKGSTLHAVRAYSCVPDADIPRKAPPLPRLIGAVVVNVDGRLAWSLAPNGEWINASGFPVYSSAVERALSEGGRVVHDGVDIDLPF